MELYLFLVEQAPFLRRVILSGLETSHPYSKVEYLFFESKGKLCVKESYLIKSQAFHNSYNLQQGLERIAKEFESYFRQALIFTSTQEIQLVKLSNRIKKIVKDLPNVLQPLQHNRKKTHFLSDSNIISSLIDCELITSDGKPRSKMIGKFNQINQFINLIHKEIEIIKSTNDHITCVDIGCGKGYLTFALYHYLLNLGFKSVHMVGLDLKEDVIQKNQDIAKKHQLQGLKFLACDANQYQPDRPIDVVIALHACNNATDMAIAISLKWKAKGIFLAPCCQQFLFPKIKQPLLNPLLKYGLFKERFAALITDALRACFLENKGYQVEVAEFVDREDSLKNILIKAILSEKPQNLVLKEENELKRFLNIQTWLDLHHSF